MRIILSVISTVGVVLSTYCGVVFVLGIRSQRPTDKLSPYLYTAMVSVFVTSLSSSVYLNFYGGRR